MMQSLAARNVVSSPHQALLVGRRTHVLRRPPLCPSDLSNMKGSPMTLAIETPTVYPAVAERLAREPHVFVDGKAEAPLSGETLPVLDPATGRTIATAASGDADDVARAVEAATRAFDPA